MHPQFPWKRRALTVAYAVVWFVLTLLAACACFFTSFLNFGGVAAAYKGLDYTAPDAETTGIGTLLAFAVVFMPITLFLRRKWPYVPVIAGLVMTLVFQLDALLALMGIASLAARRRGRAVTIWAAIVGASALSAGIRDGLRPWNRSSFALLLNSDYDPAIAAQQGDLLRFCLSAGAAVTGCILAAAYVFIRRSRRELQSAKESTLGERRRSQSLSTQVAQQEERELLAREVHDTLAHRLSLISLHSGSLDLATRSEDPTIATAAKVLQENAHQSLDDLRRLIGMLRDPTARIGSKAEVPTPPTVGMTDLADLLDSSRRAGLTINSTIMLSDIAGASAMLDKAVFRIVQEAITNVHKHAPTSTVWLSISAVAQKGVEIRVANRIASGNANLAPLGSGSGLIGIRERVRIFGGTDSIGPDGEGNFIVQVWLPWQD